jgi:iron complex outermembrane receptor protein/outer membrane receptor for ferrienterochelin and colicins
LALGNNQLPYDVDGDDFTELPKSQDFTINPKLFFYPNKKTTLMIGNSFTQGERTGGDINYIKGNRDSSHTYFEKNNTLRDISTLEFNTFFKEKNHLTVKSSFSYFEREISIPDYIFKGINNNSFTDISYVHNFKKHTLIIGGNFIYDDFVEKKITAFPLRNFTTITGGLYIQHTWDVAKKFQLESGVRLDAVNYYNANYNNSEAFVLPRVSALFKITDKLTSRVGGGLGYKTPSLFTEQTESFQYKNVLPLNNVTSEKSAGGTADISFKTGIGKDFYFAINEMFFYTYINNATVISADTVGNYYFSNTTKGVQSLGFETNVKLIYKENFKLFIGYTYNEAKAYYLIGNQFLPLLPRNKLNLALVYEKEKNFKLGLEGYFTDNQYLSTGAKTPSFWEFGFMAEKTFGILTLFVNFENFTNVRQSEYKRVVNEPHNNPTFDEIWTHTEGFVINGGIKIKLVK